MNDTIGKPPKPGIAARGAAVNAIGRVLGNGSFLDAALEDVCASIEEARDKAFAHAIAAMALRHKGQIEQVLEAFMERPLDRSAKRAGDILLAGAAQLLFMNTEAHAAINTAVTLADRHANTRRYKALINAVLRRLAENREAIVRDLPSAITGLPVWLQKKLRADFGLETAEVCAEALLRQADLDLSLRDDSFRQQLVEAGGQELPTGSVRFTTPYPAISTLPGYEQGAWWVQDAAAALPARLLGDVSGRTVLDMCAAPGGKTLQLAAAGAGVTALDISPGRLDVIAQNLARTGLSANCIAADGLSYSPDQQYDAVLLDAPCSATGTIRRHPELPWLRRPDDLKQLTGLQRKLLRQAAGLLKPGGTLVYAVCSLLAEESSKQVQAFLNENRNFKRQPATAEQLSLTPGFITRHGDLRTLPHMMLGSSSGMDGFYAARLLKTTD